MQPLDKTLRSQLERAVKAARDTAETGARAALEQLGVGDPAPASHLSETDRELRRKLRAHGRQLGDALNGGGHGAKAQTMDRLVEEVAYEHWHRMLFARFLAENDLLMYPDPDEPVAITLEECEDLAADEGAANGWELAARYAARMLPQIFRLDSPVFQLTLPPEHQQALERRVAGLPLEVFTASDSLGWVYQFWQSKKKEQVNQSEVKIGARELPAVTQLFTEPYMVSFLLDNSLGAWWAARQLSESDLKHAESEDELRQKVSIPGVPLEYLRFVKQENGTWTPAAGTFDAWPEQLADLKTLDPCCGSGHFLVAAFLMLVPMRMERDGLSARDAVDAVLRENIHGLELDQRCVELAAFALALAAWKYPGAEGYRPLPELNLACTGLSISVKKNDWLALSGGNSELQIALEELYKQFIDAPLLGSLIDPASSLRKDSLFELQWEKISPLLSEMLSHKEDIQSSEMGVVALGLFKATQILIENYHCIVTNVPFKNSGAMSDTWKEYVNEHYPKTNKELASVFVERMMSLLSEHGVVAMASPQGLLYKDYHSKYRKWLLEENAVSIIGFLGSSAFSEVSGEEVVTSLSIVCRKRPNRHSVGLLYSDFQEIELKSSGLKTENIYKFDQKSFINKKAKNIIAKHSAPSRENSILSDIATHNLGICTGDGGRFYRFSWEISDRGRWSFIQGTTDESALYSGLHSVINLGGNDSSLIDYISLKLGEERVGSWIRGRSAWGKPGVIISATGDLKSSLYFGGYFDENTVVLTCSNDNLRALWALTSSPEYNSLVRSVDTSLKVRGSLVRCRTDLDLWKQSGENNFPRGLPSPFTNDPVQWIFHGHPCGSVIWDENQKWTAKGPLRTDDTVLQVAVARLLGYRWPAELDTEMELADEQREWVKRCEALLPFADEDGIVCIPPVRGEASATDRLLNLLAAAYGEAWSTDVLADLLKNADHAGKTLETWLRDKFFAQHCKLFQHRPFIWHIWDGLPDGFAALVNYHKLDRKNLETLIYTYLGDWISRQKQDINNSIDGAEERLAAAEALKKKLEQILEGEAPYDIFVRWKHIEQQPIGWEPDLNDGVRLNIRPFMTVADVKKKGAGILRDKPNIKWTKDRGKDVESAPWYHLFKGERINDHHLTLAEKRAAREKV